MSNSESSTRKGRSRRRAAAWFLARWTLVGAIWTGFFATLFLAWCAYDLPGPERLNELKRRPSVTLLAADGSLIAELADCGSAEAQAAADAAHLAFSRWRKLLARERAAHLQAWLIQVKKNEEDLARLISLAAAFCCPQS